LRYYGIIFVSFVAIVVKKIRYILLFCLLSFALEAQYFTYRAKDSLTFQSRSGSSTNDSLDLLFATYVNLNPGGSAYHPFGWRQTDYFSFVNNLSNPFQTLSKPKTVFSALPHLGFAYSFGQNGAQFMHTDYQQAISNYSLINFTFDVNALGEILRNGTYRNSFLNFQFLYQKNRVKNEFDITYQQSTFGLNGGVADTNELSFFPLNLIAVNKSNALSKKTQAFITNQFAFNLLKDSTRFLGPTLKNKWQIQNREFTERDDLASIYSQINIDSSNTRDQYQVAKISSGAGLFFQSKLLTSEVLINHTYWDYQNLARHNDTNELQLEWNLFGTWRNFRLKNDFNYNFIGAKGEMNECLELSHVSRFLVLALKYSFSQFLPLIQQRNYFSNNQDWKLAKLSLQARQELKLSVDLLTKVKVNASVSYLRLDRHYFFIQNQWRNDTLTKLDFLSFQLKTGVKWRAFGVQPYVAFNFSSSKLLPSVDARLRLYLNKKVFKDKKLDFIIGIEGSYLSGFQLLNYQVPLGVFTPMGSLFSTRTNIGFDFFTGIQVNVFRFFLRVENIDYNLKQSTSYTMLGSPTAPMFFRLGLTWDFFN
jgi:hypothetical protein